MSVRELLNNTSSLVMSLKPIFMMSPLAVANYLDPEKFHFDCVIFDEASQINTEDAIGAIYRANQLIVVGDKEQLPPTSFFDTDLEDEEDDNSYESVLDELSAILPSIMLKWHYRSQDESLITYSNKEIYHDLTSFPANTISADLGLSYNFVEGVYEAGKRVNMIEAEKVVDLLFYEFRHNPSKSIGIVTFNMSQQYLIWSLINKRRKKDSAYEQFFDESLKEPFFVKN
jgi:superfamily I DNA and/or RNA helicase